MRKRTLPILSVVLAALPVFSRRAGARAIEHPADPRDQEIQLLKTEINQLEHRVDTLEGLDQKVKVIDRKLEVQQEVQHQRELEMPIVKVERRGIFALLAEPRLQSWSRRNHPGRWPLLHQRRGQKRRQHILPEPGAPDSDRLGWEVLQLQHHARLRPGQGHAAGRLHQYDVLGLCEPQGRQVQSAARPRALAVGPRSRIQRAFGNSEPGAEPRHRFLASRQTAGRARLL